MKIMYRWLFLFVLLCRGQCTSAQRPNIILIVADDLGYGDLSCYNRNAPLTPNLDQLAEGGVRFIHAYAASTSCRQSQLAILTGRYPGESHPMRPQQSSGRRSKHSSFFAEKLREGGYQTFFIGRWDPGTGDKAGPLECGFDYFFGFVGEAIDYYTHRNSSGKGALIENRRPTAMKGYATDLFTRKAIDILRMDHGDPFLICLYYNAPHWPWQNPADTVSSPVAAFSDQGGDTSIHTRMIRKLDDGIGELMKVLEDQQLENNTLVIFTSDAGGSRLSQPCPLSGFHPSLQEGGIRVPAIMRWPGIIAAHAVSEQSCISMDWYSTMLRLPVATVKTPETPDGINLLPYVSGLRRPVTRSFGWVVTQPTRQQALRDGYWKYLKDDKGEHLYNLLYDPGEKNDLVEVEPEQLVRLRSKLADQEQRISH